MRTVMNSLSSVLLAFLTAITFTACDPCGNAVCENGTCTNGTCVCETGYMKDGISCVGVNQYFVTASGDISATVTTKQGTGTPQTTNGVAYTLSAPKSTPYVFSILNFASVASNDIMFTVSQTNFEVLKSPQTVITAALKTYEVSGARVGTQVTLNIKDVAANVNYTISYKTKP